MPRDPDAPLIGEVLAAVSAQKLTAPVEQLQVCKGTPKGNAVLGRVIEKAKVVQLDRSAVRAATAASLMPPSALVKMMARAVPPHLPLWLEWNEVDRINALAEASGPYRAQLEEIDAATSRSGQAARVGYLFVPDVGDTQHRGFGNGEEVMAHGFARIFVGPQGMPATTWCPIGLAWTPGAALPPKPINDPTRLLLSPIYLDEFEGSPAERAAAEVLAGNLGFCVGMGISAEAARRQRDDMIAGAADMRAATAAAAVWLSGDVRFLIAALWLWHQRTAQQAPSPAVTVPWRRKGRTGWRREAVEAHTLSVDLPRLVAPRAPGGSGDGSGAPKRAHDVSGHWRKRRKNPGVGWVNPHRRGDEALGRVETSYRATAAGIAEKAPA